MTELELELELKLKPGGEKLLPMLGPGGEKLLPMLGPDRCGESRGGTRSEDERSQGSVLGDDYISFTERRPFALSMAVAWRLERVKEARRMRAFRIDTPCRSVRFTQ